MNDFRLCIALWLLSKNKYTSPSNQLLLRKRVAELAKMRQCI